MDGNEDRNLLSRRRALTAGSGIAAFTLVGGTARASGKRAAATDAAQSALPILDNLFVPRVDRQPAEEKDLRAWRVEPSTPGFAPFEIHVNSFPNTGAGAGTLNRGAWIGWNSQRHGGKSPTEGSPAIMMGLEDNYYDPPPGDGKFGVEWYVQVFSPDGLTTSLMRPLYCRVIDTSTEGPYSSIITFDIGTGGEGFFDVRAGLNDNSLFTVRPGLVEVVEGGAIQVQLGSVGPDGKAGLTFGGDMQLYRSTPGILKTDGSMEIGDGRVERHLTVHGIGGAGLGARLSLSCSTFGRSWAISSGNSRQAPSSLVISDDSAGFNRFILSYEGNMGLNTMSGFGAGKGVIGIANATLAPTKDPSDGGVLYTEEGALMFRGSAGTVTTVAPA